ncbi:hypothetical protein COCON_G00183980 [Conger conger]|uniref:DUF1279 domain-containing protein n=1 Tax=Conger conger TaxID=82655 RepID=A0A9Q1D6A7_CONCO|nr:protein FAM210B, mitochondrial [Conger conger]KAJ8259386.1 hypothetical protein COCON_G00183980 [Conger conger]
MYSCWGMRMRLTTIQRFNSYDMKIQVEGTRLKGYISCALHNHHKSPCNRQLYEDFDENHLHLFSLRGGSRITENNSQKSWGPKRFIEAAHLGRQSTPCVSVPTSAQSSYHLRNRHNTGSPFFGETRSDTHTRRFQRLGVIEPGFLTFGAGRVRLVFPTTAVQMRASSTAVAQKREALPEDTAADLKADQPQGEASGTGTQGPATAEPKPEGPQPPGPEPEGPKLNKTQQLKKLFKEYGAVAIVAHIGISLTSLGICYLVISSGIDMASILSKLGFSEAIVRSKMAAGTSTFVLAYAVHKLLLPVRGTLTLASVPLIVRYCRRTGLFKPPATPP